MNDLDQIAITDMKHEQCDIRPCFDCADFAYQVKLNDREVDVFYGSHNARSLGSDGRKEALDFAKKLKGIAGHLPVQVFVFDLNSDAGIHEHSCYYDFFADGTSKKVG